MWPYTIDMSTLFTLSDRRKFFVHCWLWSFRLCTVF